MSDDNSARTLRTDFKKSRSYEISLQVIAGPAVLILALVILEEVVPEEPIVLEPNVDVLLVPFFLGENPLGFLDPGRGHKPFNPTITKKVDIGFYHNFM